MTTRWGFNCRELMVALAVVTALAALLLVGIMRMRESAARVNCHNNLRQLSLAVANCHDASQQLPPVTGTDTDLRSVFVWLGPFIEAYPSWYRPGRSSADAYHAPSSVVFRGPGKGEEIFQRGGDANQFWRVLLDPADPMPKGLRDIPMTLQDGTTGYYATGNYAANGLLPWGQTIGAKGLGDWPAPAILFAERPQVCRTADRETVHNLWGVGFHGPSMPTFATLTPASPPGLWSTGQIAPAGTGAFRIGRADAEPRPIDFPAPFQVLRCGQPCDPRMPGTPHRAGMNVAMSDGSVRVFAPGTAPDVFWAACAGPTAAP